MEVGAAHADASGNRPAGKLGANLSPEEGYKLARDAAITLLATLRRELGSLDRVRNGEAPIPGRPIYANRIHRDDCVGVLRHLLALERPDPLYLAGDEDPAEIAEVLRWLAARLGAPQPHVDSQETGMRYGRTSNKRVRSARLRASGYRFRFPTFREGYGALIAARG